ncbi:hypothetical protein MTO96_031370 [Rhipicephalus appendiculatus]
MRSGAEMTTTAAAANDNKPHGRPERIYIAHDRDARGARRSSGAVCYRADRGPTITRATDNATAEEEEDEDGEKKG